MDSLKEQNIKIIISNYYDSVSNVEHGNSPKDNLTLFCKNALDDSILKMKWELFKDTISSRFKNHTSLTFDTELINNAPSFRYGLEIVNNANQLTTFSFYISLIMPFFSWYFVDREKYPKDELRKKISLGPTKDKFYELGLESEYNKLNSGQIQSVTDINLPQSDLLNFLTPSPRFFCINEEEEAVRNFFSEKVSLIFNGYEYLDNDISRTEIQELAPKNVSPPKNYTYFDCLFTGDLTYT